MLRPKAIHSARYMRMVADNDIGAVLRKLMQLMQCFAVSCIFIFLPAVKTRYDKVDLPFQRIDFFPRAKAVVERNITLPCAAKIDKLRICHKTDSNSMLLDNNGRKTRRAVGLSFR